MTDGPRNFRSYRGWALAGVAACLLASYAPAQSQIAPSRSLGFVVTTWGNAFAETHFGDECPEGTAITNDEVWLKSLNMEQRAKLTNKGMSETLSRTEPSFRRGPNGEDICWHPEAFKDPPLREVQSKVAYGFNLDGTEDGHATPTTCSHEKFVGPNGEPAVDNQMFRVLGCENGWRHGGVLEIYADQERRSSGRGLILIEITNVDDPRNDNDVTVGFYRSLDPMPQDAAGEILPFSSYRIDSNPDGPRYGDTAHGRIVDGVLMTDPADVTLPFYGNETYTEMAFRHMRLKLEMNANERDAQGLLGGYYDLDKWWDRMKALEYLNASYDIDCPAVYEAAYRLADGYPDPKTGTCTAISSAYDFHATAAFVIHPDNEPAKKTAQASRPVQTASDR